MAFSEELNRMEQDQYELIDAYYRASVEREVLFLDNVWLPLFLKYFFEEDDVRNGCDIIAKTTDQQVRIAHIRSMSKTINHEYKVRYDKLMTVLDTTREELRADTRKKFDVARNLNNTVQKNVRNAYQTQQMHREIFKGLIGLVPSGTIIGKSVEKIASIRATILSDINNKN